MICRTRRWSVYFPVQFACPEYVGDGMTLDVSAEGLCIITTVPVAANDRLYIQLLPPERSVHCIECQVATVRWCDGGRIGLELSSMTELDRERFLSVLQKVEQKANREPDQEAPEHP